LSGPYLYGGVSFSDEANMLAAVTNEPALRLFDLETSAVLGDVIVSDDGFFSPAPTEVVFDPGGEWLAAIVDGRGVVLLDASGRVEACGIADRSLTEVESTAHGIDPDGAYRGCW
jgi:hypothetical protein